MHLGAYLRPLQNYFVLIHSGRHGRRALHDLGWT